MMSTTEHTELLAKLTRCDGQLLADGYAVIDEALNPATAAALHKEMESLRSGSGLRRTRHSDLNLRNLRL
jgi:hypothetical protein